MTNTAREIIENRLGHPLPPTKYLAPDERKALLLLGLQLLKHKGDTND